MLSQVKHSLSGKKIQMDLAAYEYVYILGFCELIVAAMHLFESCGEDPLHSATYDGSCLTIAVGEVECWVTHGPQKWCLRQ